MVYSEGACACGGKYISGHMYGKQFVAGNTNLRLAFRDKEFLLREIFPNGIPNCGGTAKICVNCFRIIKE